MRANMMYDLADGPPEAGSLLESIFLLITKRRMEAEFLKTKVLVRSILAHAIGGEGLSEAVDQYAKLMFPFLESQKEAEKRDIRKALEKWVSVGPVRVRPIQFGVSRKMRSKMKQRADHTKKLEEDRRKKRHRRI